MVLAILAAVVFAVLRLTGGGGDSAASVSTETSPGHQQASLAGPPDHRGAQGSNESHSVHAGSHQGIQEPGRAGACRPGQIQLTPVVADGIRVGQEIAIQIALRVTGIRECTFDVTPDDLVVDITTSKGDPVWTTDDCAEAITPIGLALRADKPAIVQVTWNGTRSDARCSPSTVRSAAGDYEVLTAIIGGEPAQASFTLAQPLPRATPSATPSSGPSSGASPGQPQASSSPSSGHT
jgi:hypothetical protein